MEYSDKNSFLEAFGKEPLEGEGKKWEDVEHKEREMIDNMQSFIGRSSQQLSKKSADIMKEWKEK
jgi:transketolase N-terminal domain/subunit